MVETCVMDGFSRNNSGRSQHHAEALVDCLQSFLDDGTLRITASMVAERLYPGARTQNANGQVFNLAAGSVGRQLRRCRGVSEIEPRVWQIVPELLGR